MVDESTLKQEILLQIDRAIIVFQYNIHVAMPHN